MTNIQSLIPKAWFPMLVLVAALFFACKPPGARQQEAPIVSEGLKVGIQEVTRAAIDNRLRLSGVLAPWEQVPVISKLTGKLVAIDVQEGQFVGRDEVIAQVNKDEPGQEYKDMQITAPIAGVVGKRMVDAGSLVSPATPLAVILNVDQLKVTVNVIESEIGLLRQGQTARIAVPAFPDRTFAGSVHNILPIVDPISHTAKTEISIPNSGRTLKVGMSATVDLILGRHTDVVVIPLSAIIEKMGEKYVFLFSNGQARKTNIRTGYESGTMVEVVSGIQAGDKLITTDLNVIKDGTKVRAREG
jgi:multidrug efflux pump subunit AcrA (membrane-fusion protein)